MAVLAESCTAGLVADRFAQEPGASKVLWGSFVCYTIEAKIAMLGLDESMLRNHGMVSCECACAMAEAAQKKSRAVLALSVTGLAGPGGDDRNTPVGTVWIAVKNADQRTEAQHFLFTGSRNEIRDKAAEKALETLVRASGQI
ncbi:hypothetical protein FACS1894164_01980 [Spirochaetia bacterium]|nr:hypothetical protein FACS1894164_01980 [Spirochaetia bacterium]